MDTANFPGAHPVDFSRLPRHIAIIMDGNGRWARARRLPRTAGHAAGAEAFRRIAKFSKELGIEYLTVYAFSTENWSRPQAEVDTIMDILRRYLREAIEEMQRDSFRMFFFGDRTQLDPELRALCDETEARSRRMTGCQVNICLNYGGRDEILRAARTFAAACAAGEKTPDQLDGALFESYLYSAGIPDPDLIIRPSGEQRLSNFLLWQAAYAELYYTDVCWPEFKREDLLEALWTYQQRSRRFGGT